MEIRAITSVAVVTDDPEASRRLYVDALGLPLRKLDGDYFATDELDRCGHFGVWPLSQAAQACFGVADWPADVPRPQMSIEFEVIDKAAVTDAAEELVSYGFELLHETKTEPWGQTLIRLLSPESVIVGVSYAPALHDDDEG